MFHKKTEDIMGIWELLIMAVALSMDAFAVSICKGLATTGSYIKTGLVCGIWFGAFQALMPFIGWLLGSTVSSYIESYSAYIAFALLAFLGVKMIWEALSEAREQKKALAEGINACGCANNEKNASLGVKVMLVFAIATSIDALAAGLSLAAMGANIFVAITFIGITTFLFSFVGAAAGSKIGSRFSTKAQIAGGMILLALGIKILVENFI